MADSEYNTGNHKTLKISIEVVLQNAEMKRYVPD